MDVSTRPVSSLTYGLEGSSGSGACGSSSVPHPANASIMQSVMPQPIKRRNNPAGAPTFMIRFVIIEED